MIHIGIDPGANGAIVAFFPKETKILRFDKSTEREISQFLLDLAWDDEDDKFAMLEKITPMPQLQRGAVASFKLGASYGFLRGCLVSAKIPFDEVSPQKWQGFMGCPSKGDKKITRAKAQQLFPHLKVVHSNADALLIAEYCRRKI